MAETQYYHLLIYEGTSLIGSLVNNNPETIDAALHAHDEAISALQARVPAPGSAANKFLRDDGTWQNIPLPGQATSSALGTLKIGYSESGKYYALKLDANGKGYVYVPWENTTYPDATTSAHGLMSAADKTKLNGIAAGAQVNPGVATTSANGLMSSSDKSKLNGIAAGAQVNPGVATTSANGLMSKDDKTKLNGIAAGAQKNPGNFTTAAAGLTPASGNANNILAGNGWATLQNLVNVLQTTAYVRINNWNGKPHIRYGQISNVESNKAGFVDFASVSGEAFPNNCLYVGITLDSSFQASARVSVTSFAKNGFNYNVYANNGQNLTFHFIAFGY